MAEKFAKINGHPVAESARFVSRIVGNGHRAFMSVANSLFVITIDGVAASFTALNDAATFVAKKVGAIDGTPDTRTLADGTVVPNERRQGGTSFWAPLDTADAVQVSMRGSGIYHAKMIEATKGIEWSDEGLKSGYAVPAKAAAAPKALPSTIEETTTKINRAEKTIESMERNLGTLRSHLAALKAAGSSAKKTENAPAEAAAKPAGGKGGKGGKGK